MHNSIGYRAHDEYETIRERHQLTQQQDTGLDLLAAGAGHMGIVLTRRQTRQFELYRDLLVDWNTRFNLTSVDDPAGIQTRHFLDSIAALPYIPTSADSLIDIGSGAGFPGIPLHILRPDMRTTLLEATGKKCVFLETVVKTLRLSNVSVVHGRAELQAQVWGFRERFTVATARAVASLPVLAELALPFVKLGGYALFWKKGDMIAEIAASTRANRSLGGTAGEVHDVVLPGLDEHLIVAVQKVEPTSSRYPRRPGIPERQPLS